MAKIIHLGWDLLKLGCMTMAPSIQEEACASYRWSSMFSGWSMTYIVVGWLTMEQSRCLFVHGLSSADLDAVLQAYSEKDNGARNYFSYHAKYCMTRGYRSSAKHLFFLFQNGSHWLNIILLYTATGRNCNSMSLLPPIFGASRWQGLKIYELLGRLVSAIICGEIFPPLQIVYHLFQKDENQCQIHGMITML